MQASTQQHLRIAAYFLEFRNFVKRHRSSTHNLHLKRLFNIAARIIRAAGLLELLHSVWNHTRHLSELLPGTYYSSSSWGNPTAALHSLNPLFDYERSMGAAQPIFEIGIND